MKKLPVKIRTRFTEASFRADVAALGLLRPPLAVHYHRYEYQPWEVWYTKDAAKRYDSKKEALLDISLKCADLQESL